MTAQEAPGRGGAVGDYTYDFIAVEVQDRIAICTLNRPEALNSITRDGHHELESLFAQLSADAAVGAAVITGAGRAFCAGGDVKGMDPDMYDSPAGIFDSGARDLVAKLLGIEKPVIAAVNGDAVGLGATIALACDVVFMADGARIGDPHVRVGLVPGDGGAVLWPLLVGPSRAKEYLMTGDLIAAGEAERIGLVNHVCPPERVLDDATAFAGRLATGATLAIRFAKLSVQRTLLQSVLNTLDLSLALEALTGKSRDYEEAIAAFSEKRKPVFEGK
jgi:enoyl-CoA hydratase